MSNLPYYEQKDIENIQKLRTMLKELPPFCTEYFRGIEPRTSNAPELLMPMICLYFLIF